MATNRPASPGQLVASSLVLGVLLFATFTPTATAATLLNVNIAAPSQRANQVETWMIQFTTVGAVGGGGDIRIVFPAGFSLSAGVESRCDVQLPESIVTEETTIENGNTIVCDLGTGSIPANTPTRVTISNVQNPGESGTTAPFLVQTRSSAGAVIDSHNTNTEEILPESEDSLRGVQVVGESQRTGVSETWQIQFQTSQPVPAGGAIYVKFPPGFRLSSEPKSECILEAPAHPTNATLVSDTELLCVLETQGPITRETQMRLRVTGVRNPTTEQYTSHFVIETRDGETVLDQSTMNQELITAHDFLSGPAHNMTTSAPNATASHRFEFTLFNGWAGDGLLKIGFASGFRPATSGSPTVAFLSGGSGSFQLKHTLQDAFVFERTQGASLFGGARIIVRLDNVTNPEAEGAYMGFIISTQNATGATHDRGITGGLLIRDEDSNASPSATTTAPATNTTATVAATDTTATEANTTASPTETGGGSLTDAPSQTTDARGQGAPGLQVLPVLAALGLACLLFVRRRKA